MSYNYSRLFLEGDIASWYLRESQLELYKMLLSNKKVVVNTHRRYGKGTTTLIYIFERCLTENIIVRYGTDTIKHAYSIFDFLLDKIFSFCPMLKPKKIYDHYLFHTGAKIYIYGVKDSNEIDKARGVESDVIVLDEYGFFKFKPEYVLKSVLTPQTLECDGQIIITSTPPEDMTHHYIQEVAIAEKNNYYFKWTIMDTFKAGEKTKEEIDSIVEDCGGKDSEHFQREYMCNLVANSERLVIPEAKASNFVGKQERPPYLDSYICMDLGLIDYTAVLFAYLDFEKSLLVVEKEYFEHYKSTSELVDECRKIEKELNLGNPYRRIADCEMQQIFDMTNDHDYPVAPITKRSRQTGKGFRDSVINQIRLGISQGKLLISEEGCPNLIMQLKYGIWNEKRTDFARTDKMGHLDALMSLCYLYDNISWNKNPYPDKFSNHKLSDSYISQSVLDDRSRSGFESLVGR